MYFPKAMKRRASFRLKTHLIFNHDFLPRDMIGIRKFELQSTEFLQNSWKCPRGSNGWGIIGRSRSQPTLHPEHDIFFSVIAFSFFKNLFHIRNHQGTEILTLESIQPFLNRGSFRVLTILPSLTLGAFCFRHALNITELL